MMRKLLSALVATAGLSALVSPTAAAEDLEEAGAVIRLGKSCAGSDVVRCAWIEWDYRYYRARALVSDPSNVGYDQDIAVSRLRFQYESGGRWVTMNETPDYDGWKDTSDGAIGGWSLCQRRIRAVAYFQWRRHGAVSWTGEWKGSHAVYRSC